MKTLFTTLLLFVTLTAFAQDPMYEGIEDGSSKSTLYKEPLPVNPTTGKVEFQHVINVEGKSNDELYTNAREWFAKTFVSANAVLQMDDRNAGIIIGKGKLDSYTDILIKIETKDGRIRYTMTDIMYGPTTKNHIEQYVLDNALYKKNGSPRNLNRILKEKILTANLSFLSSLTDAVSTQASTQDW